MMGVLTLFTVYMEDNTMMVALEKDEAGVVSPKEIPPLPLSLPCPFPSLLAFSEDTSFTPRSWV